MPARKKDPSARARANKAATKATLPSTGRPGRKPQLPKDVRDWHPQTIAWWKDVWSSPMSNEYHTSDRHRLFVIAMVVDDFWTATSPTARKEAASEIRLQTQAFGLTPYDRRRLEWTIETAAQAQERGKRQRSGSKTSTTPAATPPAPADDPRRALYAVTT